MATIFIWIDQSIPQLHNCTSWTWEKKRKNIISILYVILKYKFGTLSWGIFPRRSKITIRVKAEAGACKGSIPTSIEGVIEPPVPPAKKGTEDDGGKGGAPLKS